MDNDKVGAVTIGKIDLEAHHLALGRIVEGWCASVRLASAADKNTFNISGIYQQYIRNIYVF